jgi:hypothetical protein
VKDIRGIENDKEGTNSSHVKPYFSVSYALMGAEISFNQYSLVPIPGRINYIAVLFFMQLMQIL